MSCAVALLILLLQQLVIAQPVPGALLARQKHIHTADLSPLGAEGTVSIP